ncbi:hypothetical protein [Terrimonas pollutisoli]|uniref:hypothetical protein n=1 Tax=Terrimonas pollutisoli TaxID=3034147 RepID=UPI0023EB26F7|nr:hypothetical protein [Terrimonas sp. H1YJ31]
MNKGIKALLAFVLLAGSCNNEGKTSTQVEKDSITPPNMIAEDTLSSGCYSQIVQRDTSSLQLQKKGSSLTGALSYSIYQKDRNDGTVMVEQSEDIIKGWYLFKSEGIISVRQVAWKINGEELWPATGEVTQKNDTTLFAKPDQLRFDSTRPFKKVSCVI